MLLLFPPGSRTGPEAPLLRALVLVEEIFEDLVPIVTSPARLRGRAALCLPRGAGASLGAQVLQGSSSSQAPAAHSATWTRGARALRPAPHRVGSDDPSAETSPPGSAPWKRPFEESLGGRGQHRSCWPHHNAVQNPPADCYQRSREMTLALFLVGRNRDEDLGIIRSYPLRP